MNRSYQIKREVLAEKEEQERAMRAQIRAFRSQVKDLAKTISATLAADPCGARSQSANEIVHSALW